MDVTTRETCATFHYALQSAAVSLPKASRTPDRTASRPPHPPPERASSTSLPTAGSAAASSTPASTTLGQSFPEQPKKHTPTQKGAGTWQLPFALPNLLHANSPPSDPPASPVTPTIHRGRPYLRTFLAFLLRADAPWSKVTFEHLHEDSKTAWDELRLAGGLPFEEAAKDSRVQVVGKEWTATMPEQGQTTRTLQFEAVALSGAAVSPLEPPTVSVPAFRPSHHGESTASPATSDTSPTDTYLLQLVAVLSSASTLSSPAEVSRFLTQLTWDPTPTSADEDLYQLQASPRAVLTRAAVQECRRLGIPVAPNCREITEASPISPTSTPYNPFSTSPRDASLGGILPPCLSPEEEQAWVEHVEHAGTPTPSLAYELSAGEKVPSRVFNAECFTLASTGRLAKTRLLQGDVA
ncbi:hypothetical protein JCM11641_004863 [Rhodosporidiobolus odoratus]